MIKKIIDAIPIIISCIIAGLFLFGIAVGIRECQHPTSNSIRCYSGGKIIFEGNAYEYKTRRDGVQFKDSDGNRYTMRECIRFIR